MPAGGYSRPATHCFFALAVCLLLAACRADNGQPPQASDAKAHATGSAAKAPVAPVPPEAQRASTPTPPPNPLAAAALAQIGVTRHYDPAYVRLGYPGGDLDSARGVCTDVVIRALRSQGIDLQRRIHEDRVAHPDAYPARWRTQRADSNIDHRRVPNQMIWFDRRGWALSDSARASDYAAGDIVAWNLGGGVLHVGIVSNQSSRDGTPLILHNIGRGTQQQDLLFAYRIIGHCHPRLASPPV